MRKGLSSGRLYCVVCLFVSLAAALSSRSWFRAPIYGPMKPPRIPPWHAPRD